MQASFAAHALKPFTRALACLSRYGEDLCIYASSETLTLFCTNSSKSAYCRFRFHPEFFLKYRVGDPSKGIHDTVVGQLLAKSLLSILKHKTVESTLERCDISIVEGVSAEDAADETQDGLESKLIVRLHCKHGVIKTHKLLLLGSSTLMTPGVPDSSNENLLTIGPRAIRDMIEQFSLPKGAKSDPQLIWTFGETNVEVRSLESSIDTRSKAQLATELTISMEEFDVYNLYEAPATIAFHLREFNATIAFAELSGLGLDIRFTDPSEPLFIDIEADNFDTLFVISTSQPPGAAAQSRNGQGLASSGPKKRLREDTPGGDSVRFKKPTKAVQSTTDPASVMRSRNVNGNPNTPSPSSSGSTSRQIQTPLHATPLPNPNASQRPFAPPVCSALDTTSFIPPPSAAAGAAVEPPLFLPSSSQLSITNESALREAGLGIEHMTAEEFDEFNEMLEADGEEVRHGGAREEAPSPQYHNSTESFDLMEVVDEPIAATQHPVVISDDQLRAFYPLFED